VKPIQLTLSLVVLLIGYSSAKSFTVDIEQDFKNARFRVTLVAPDGAEVSPATAFHETQIKWNNTTLVLNITDSARNLNMMGAKQIRSSDANGRKLQVFQDSSNAFNFSLSLRSSVVKGIYISCANSFSLSSLAQVNEAIKVCDSAKILKKL
jgi:hypothetical protein